MEPDHEMISEARSSTHPSPPLHLGPFPSEPMDDVDNNNIPPPPLIPPPVVLDQPSKLLSDVMKRRMFKAAMSGDWRTVKLEARNDRSALEAKITTSEDTILHYLVIEGQRTLLRELVTDLILQRREGGMTRTKILTQTNKRGNTPLHLAAAQGDRDMCRILLTTTADDKDEHSSSSSAASDAKVLIDARNDDGETPLFSAALHGKKEAFFYLLGKLDAADELGQIGRYIRRKDGNTVLHVAILGEHFDLAFQIMKVYQEVERHGEKNVLANMLNEKGQSALHILAKSAHAFRSGYHLGTINQIIYYLTWVDPLEETINDNQYAASHDLQPLSDQDDQKAVFPVNYSTCWSFLRFVQKPFGLNGEQLNGCNNKSDAENPAPSRPNGSGKGYGKRDEKKKKMTVTHVAHQYLIPPNYVTFCRLMQLLMEFTQIFLGFGFWKMKKIKDSKERHTWAVQVMDELVRGASSWEYNADGKKPEQMTATAPWALTDLPSFAPPDDLENPATMETNEPQGFPGPPLMEMISDPPMTTRYIGQIETQEHPVDDHEKREDEDKSDTPILVAAKNGVVEIVEKILKAFPVAIQDVNRDGKNIVLLAVEHRQPFVYQLLCKKFMKESVFQKVDKDGNSALHLAAALGTNRPWIIPGAALQMQWEIKWYKFVKSSMRPQFFMRLNNEDRTAKEIFTETHREQVKDGGEWLNKTSESCSVVAALIATVAFAAAVTVPGGVKEDRGTPILEGKPAFDIFAISSLVALSLSVTSLIMFLSILTSRHASRDFEWSLPRKLMIGLTSLFFSIASILLSFCAGHYFILRNHLRHVAFSMYAVSCLPVLLFAFAQFPLYFDLLRAIFTPVPHRTYKETAY
ncbi:hypothetical protein H6P81_004633 [Aristolochia fimbriata]|uniref:PGG domain-containing protein n=1 Tax=Aristolochia fimbriata TaxID=158543 RepID=A0AAV7ET59_ARIFI|nr:hypothetical protein H6P81_004633 [Aristolochia fimbriata]